ncbi:hypothetical protein WJX72_011941 [[Myrmecia] bisecta]|uniref:Uncharacterized protein n=1 Tax=[Myrmecia] bisecta TaxID=41462 RepID=A0AAW1PY05_9CHLO
MSTLVYTSAPELNDILHLQHRGITKLENLEAYTGLKTLYLECNAIDTIEGLSQAINLRCLYLGRNLIHEISGLASLVQLQTLDLSDNDIRRVEGLATLTELKTLNVSGNKLRTAGDIEHLRELPNLASLDLGKNRIDDESALEVVISLPLALLRMTGNPIVSSFRNYRKRLLVAMPQLNYLDDSPCTDADRRVARAFLVGGLEAERAERAAIRDEEAELREKHRQAFDDMVEAARANAAASPLPPADPMRFRAVPVGESESDEEGALPSKRPSRQPAAEQGDGPAQRSRPSEPQGQGRPLVWGTQQYGDLWQMALQVGAAQEADGDAGEEMSIRGGQTGATLRPSLSSHVMDSADDLWDAGWDAGSQSETSSDSDVDADPMERYSVTSTAQEPAVAQHSAARRAGLVDRQDSAHYEPRPVALVERRDSAHDLAPTPSTTAPLDLGRRDSAHEPQWSASPTDSSLGEAPLAELTPSPAARRAGASLRPSLLSHTSTSASLDSAMEEIAEEGSQHTDFSRHPDERQARIRRDSAAEPLTLARQVVAAAEGGRGSGRLASAQHMLGRPALRQDSALDPLVEARRAVLDDLHSNPPTSSLGSPGRPQSGTPEDSRNAHPGLLGESSPQEDSARDSLLETRRAALRAGPEPDIMNELAQEELGPRSGCYPEARPVRRRDPGLDPAQDQLAEARRLILQDLADQPGPSGQVGPSLWPAGFPGDSASSSSRPDLWRDSPLQPILLARQAMHNSAAAAADSPDADAAGPSSSPTAGIPARHDSAHDLHELRRRQQQQHQQHRDMASTSSVQE